ncbi:MAG: ABC transporter ATP-binding protein [Alistipes sp.]|nr:ABC transporter ATP-binding protein [Alistipes sp.]
MLRINQVKKTYGNFTLSVSMEVKKGYITGVIGRNGAGKSTTFKTVLSLVRPDEGEVRLFGSDVRDLSGRDKERLGVVLSESGFSDYLRVVDVAKIMKNCYKRFDEKAFLEKCGRFELPTDKPIGDFSTGMKAKLKVLTAMSHEAEFLLVDEPTAGLDVVARDELLDMMREYMEDGERSILISSHISTDLEGLCDDLYLIHDGKILLHEETDKLLSDYGLLKVSGEQYEKLDKRYILGEVRESYGYRLITNEKQFYLENEPRIVVEKSSVDEVISVMTRGE